jgi:hypothetical protein
MRIQKKVWPEFYQLILDGKKNFELRLANFTCRPGDILVLQEWDPEADEPTGRLLEKEVTYVLRTKKWKFWSQEDLDEFGLQIISFKDVEAD